MAVFKCPAKQCDNYAFLSEHYQGVGVWVSEPDLCASVCGLYFTASCINRVHYFFHAVKIAYEGIWVISAKFGERYLNNIGCSYTKVIDGEI